MAKNEQIQTGKTASLREEFPLEKRKIIKRAIGPIFVALVLTLPAAIGAAIFIYSLLTELNNNYDYLLWLASIPFIFPLAAVALCIWWSNEYWKTYQYGLAGKNLTIGKGVIFKNSATIPFEKISDVYADQDILDRLFGLYDLHFSSATESSGNLSHIDGLAKTSMENLREILLSNIMDKAAPSAKSSALKTAAIEFFPSPLAYPREMIGFAGALLVMFFYLSETTLKYLGLALPLALAILAIGAIVVKKEVNSIRYEIREDSIFIKKGWIIPSETMIFHRNVQDYEKNKGLIDRLFGIEQVVVKSMSSQSAVASIVRLLTEEDADKFARILTEKTKLARKETAAEKTQVASFTRLEKPYSPNFQIGNYSGAIGLALFSIPAGILLLAFSKIIAPLGRLSNWGWILLLAPLGALIIGFVVATIKTLSFSYYLESDGLVISYDFISKSEKKISYAKMQDIKLTVGIFEDLFFKTGQVTIESGSKDIVQSKEGQSETSLPTALETIPYLKISDALDLRKTILERCQIALPDSKEPLVKKMPLSENKPLKKTVAFIFYPMALCLLASVALLVGGQLVFAGISLGLGLALGLTLGFPKLIYEKEYLKKYFYSENSQSLLIRKGFFGYSEIAIPYKNIQSVYVDQDIFDVGFGIYDVWVTTVTATSPALSHIDGLGKNDAESLTRLLVSRIEKARKAK